MNQFSSSNFIDNYIKKISNNIKKSIVKESNIPKKYKLSKEDGIIEIKDDNKSPYEIDEDSKVEPIH